MAKKTDARIAGTYRTVNPATLVERPDNPNRQTKFMFSKLVESIREHGFTDPAIVRGNEILGGAHRVRAALSLSMAEVPVIDLGKIPDLAARKLLISLNETRGAADQDALSALVQSIHTDGGDEAIQSLPYNDAQLADLLDDIGDEPVADEEPEAPPPEQEVEAKIRASDVASVMELEGLKQSQYKKLLKEIRAWRTRTDLDIPAHELILELFRNN